MSAAINSLFCLGFALCLAAQTPAATAPDDAQEAAALVAAGKPEKAVPIFRRLVAEHPQELPLRLNLAIALYKAGDYQQTATVAQTLVDAVPDLFAGWLFVGAARAKLGESAAAEAPLRRAVKLKPDDVNAQLLLADVLAERGKPAESVKAYSAVAERLPELPRAWFGLNRGYADLARQALADLERTAPGSAERLALAGDLAAKEAQIARAFWDYREALRLQPGFAVLYTKVAALYEASGYPDWASKELEKEHKAQPSSCASQSSLACNVISGKLAEAASTATHSTADMYWQAQAFLGLSQAAYSRLMALPPSAERYEAQARREEERGHYPEAVAAWRQGLQLDPTNQELLRGLALADCHSNDCVSALPLLRELVAKYPSSAEWNYLYGLALVTVRQPLQAIPCLEKALVLDPYFLPAKGVLGEAYLEAGKPANAITFLKEAVASDEKSTRQYQLAQAYRAVGNDAEARAALQKYRETLRMAETADTSNGALTPP